MQPTQNEQHSDSDSLSTQSIIAAFKHLDFGSIAPKKPAESPFDERVTFILSPMMADTYSVFLYKPCIDDVPYNVKVSGEGTIGVNVSTQDYYDAALKYLSYIYNSKPHDEDHECVLWEVNVESMMRWGDCGQCHVNEPCRC